MDWRGREPIFHEGELSLQEVLEITEPHFVFLPLVVEEPLWRPVPEAQPERDSIETYLGWDLP